MALPGVEALLLPVMTSLLDGPCASRELAATLAKKLALSDADMALPHGKGKGTKFRNDLAWALVWLGKAGLIQKTSPGQYAITREGEAWLAAQPSRLGLADLQSIPTFADARGRSSGGASLDRPVPLAGQELDPELMLRQMANQLKEKLLADLLDGVRSLTPKGFELLVIDLVGQVLASGVGGVEHARAHLGGTGDGGVDGVIDEDPLGLGRIYVQAKRYKAGSTVGAPDILHFSGAITAKGANKGVFVTASSFTPAAFKACSDLAQVQQIKLIDGEALARLMIKHSVGVRHLETFVLQEVELGAYKLNED